MYRGIHIYYIKYIYTVYRGIYIDIKLGKTHMCFVLIFHLLGIKKIEIYYIKKIITNYQEWD